MLYYNLPLPLTMGISRQREVYLVIETFFIPFVVGIASSFVASWLYDLYRDSGNR